MKSGQSGERTQPTEPSRLADDETQPSQRSALRNRLRQTGEASAPPLSNDSFAFSDDPLKADDDAADDYAVGATPFDDDYAPSDQAEPEEYSEDASQFEYRAPFTARRNPLRMWTFAALLFAMIAGGTIIAVNLYGLPQWLPFNQPSFGIGKPDLVLEFPAGEQREDTLDTGEEIFRVSGSINNTGATSRSVPRLLVVFVDERGREVYSKVIVPSKSELAPGETLKVTEGISNYPMNAEKARIGWAPG